MSKILKIDSIAQIHKMVGYEKPKHPLISVIAKEKIKLQNIPDLNLPVSTSLYSISLKNGKECRIIYGRQPYDFQEGSLMFLAPDQLITPISETVNTDWIDLSGWILLFHPDLIRKSPLAQKMKEYTFFSYDSHEALHVSEQERKTVTNIVKSIKQECSQNIDVYSQELIISNIELLLNYCKRFYGRQFITRTNAHKDVVIRFEGFLTTYFESEKPEIHGLPSVKFCGEQMGYSPNYLSDLLKQETGKNTQEQYSEYEIISCYILATSKPDWKQPDKASFYDSHASPDLHSTSGIN